MSVFDLPRLHFTGVAVSKLPTGPRGGFTDLAGQRALTDDGPFPVDRPATEYHAWLRRRGPRFDAAGRPCAEGGFSLAEGWNFEGNGHFWLDAAITAVEGAGGPEDPVIGRSVDVWGHYNPYLRTTVNRARIFDLDPASRWTTALMVGRFGFGRLGRSHDEGYLFTGEVAGLQPPRWTQFARIAEVGEHPLAGQLRYAALHQFVVTADAAGWLPGAGRSPAATALRRAATDGLVVQLALDAMASPVAPGAPNHWRVRGTIAPWHPSELRSYPAGRLLVPCPGSPLRPLTVQLGRGRAHFNLITAVPHTHRARHPGPGPLHRLGPPLDLGELQLRTAGSDTLVARLPATVYRSEDTCGIVTVPAEPGWHTAAGEALRLTDGRRGLLAERETVIQSDEALLTLHHREPSDDHAVRVPLRSFVRGRPARARVRVRQFFNPRALPADPVAGAPTAPAGARTLLGLRAADGRYADVCTVDTDEHGAGLLTLRGERAGTCRVLLTAEDGDTPCADPGLPGSAWTAYDDPDALDYWAGAGWLAARVLPDDWHLDQVPREEVDFALLHREVFAYYEHISSFMRAEVFSLADRCKVETYAELIWQMCDPANRDRTYYMPPTRDLTGPKARLLLAYLRNRRQRPLPPPAEPAATAAGPAITTRGRLWEVLKQAAALELAVMLQYLYAAFSVPAHGAGLEYVRRGLWTPRQLRLACGQGGETADDGIRGALLNVAREEMIHFLLVNNIIMAMGEPFHIPDIDFATLGAHLPVPLDFALEGLSIGSVQRYTALEQPAPPPGDGQAPGSGWGSISELYAAVRQGLCRVPGLFLVEKGRGGGEHHLFLRESVNARHPDYQLEVDDLSSALFAVDLITEQGEGGVLDRSPAAEPSHHQTFLRIGELLAAERVPGPHGRLLPWSPAYPVLRNPTLGAGDAAKDPLTAPQARAVARLFNRSYQLMLQLMAQHFGESPDASLRRSRLMNAAIDVMTGVMRPLAEVLVTMDSGRRGRTAGPTFELETVPAPVPRPDVARRALALRFAHLAAAARDCPPVPEQAAGMLAFYADYFHGTGCQRTAIQRTEGRP
ncbi:ferritin-like domain-containing protein [Streptomyces sp. NPDC052396]|uniref:ferritin-like domain-containing protein n=1 Tax=Streptomyces sp. NPDC052396 TaxID=3365689 RepID=UPI0037D335F1